MGEGAATVSERGVILFANPQLARFLGVERDSMVGRDLTAYVGEGHREALASLLGERSTGTRRAELLVTGADGTDVPFLAAATDIDLEGVLVRCLVLTDLTSRSSSSSRSRPRWPAPSASGWQPRSTTRSCRGWSLPRWPSTSVRRTTLDSSIASTSRHARSWIGKLAGDQQLEAGMAVRSGPALQREDS